MKLSYCYLTNEGKLRPRNEDALLVPEGLFQESMPYPACRKEEGEFFTFAVADGMGGHPCGDLASRLVLQVLSRKPPSTEEEVKEFILKAKEALDRLVEEKPHCWGLGTALAVCTLTGKEALYFNVGDCRLYLLREGELYLLTEDQTYPFKLFKEGLIDYETLRTHPERNLLTGALIGGDYPPPEPFIGKVTLRVGDLLLLCSDGLWEVFSLKELTSLLSLGTLKEKAKKLFSLAYDRSRDNLSFILVELSELQGLQGSSPPPRRR